MCVNSCDYLWFCHAVEKCLCKRADPSVMCSLGEDTTAGRASSRSASTTLQPGSCRRTSTLTGQTSTMKTGGTPPILSQRPGSRPASAIWHGNEVIAFHLQLYIMLNAVTPVPAAMIFFLYISHTDCTSVTRVVIQQQLLQQALCFGCKKNFGDVCTHTSCC